MWEAGRWYAAKAEAEARRLLDAQGAPPAGDGLFDRAVRVIYDEIVRLDREAKAKANDDAFAALVESGAFQQG